MTDSTPPQVLLTGRPGIGKTTVIQRTLDRLDIPAGGFFTREMRQYGRRIGFELVTLAGATTPLATTGAHNFIEPRAFGRYTVNLQAIDRVAVPALLSTWQQGDLVVIDEIGPMEILSAAFCDAVSRVLRAGAPVLGTIMARSHPYADEIKRRDGVQVIDVSLRNRDQLPLDLSNRWSSRGYS